MNNNNDEELTLESLNKKLNIAFTKIDQNRERSIKAQTLGDKALRKPVWEDLQQLKGIIEKRIGK